MTTLPLGDISLETFLNEYWQKKPLLIKNAFPNFVPPVSADELAGLALEEEIESRLIIQSEKGHDWQLQHGPFTEDTFSQLPERHWTLLVQAVDHWIPEASDLVQQFNFIPSWRLDDLMISYAADGGGVGPHYDNYDVFLLQASGTRRWEVGGLYGENSPRRPDTPVMILPDWEAEEVWDLQPGDMLYLPPRVGHNGYAVGNDCMTYSFGFRAPSHQEIFEGLARHIDHKTKSEDRFSDPDLKQQDNPGEIPVEAINKVRDILEYYINDPVLLTDWFGQFMTEPKYPDLIQEAESNYTESEIKELLADQVTLRKTEGARIAFSKGQGQLILFADGKRLSCEEAQLPLIELLCSSNTYQQIPATSDNLALIATLLEQGSLYFEDE